MNEEIQIVLDKNQSLVLFDFLARLGDNAKSAIEDESETIVLNRLLCDLEKKLVEPFEENYNELLSKARQSIRGGNRAA